MSTAPSDHPGPPVHPAHPDEADDADHADDVGGSSSRRGVRRRRGSGHELRQVILTVSASLLADLGDVEALTMRAVADAAGVTTPSVYRHFPDKVALVRAVIEERFAAFAATLGAAAERTADGGSGRFAQLEAMAHEYVRTGLRDPGTYRVLFSATGAGPHGLGLAPGSQHPGAASFRLLLDAVAACIAPPENPDPGNVDPAQVSELAVELWASLHGVVDLRITKPEMPWPDPAALVERALVPIRAATAVRAAAPDGGAR